MARPKLDLFDAWDLMSQWLKHLRNALLALLATSEDLEHLKTADETFWRGVAMVLLGRAKVVPMSELEIVCGPSAPKQLRSRLARRMLEEGALPLTVCEKIACDSGFDASVRAAAIQQHIDCDLLMGLAISQQGEIASAAVRRLNEISPSFGYLKRVILRAVNPQIRHEAADALGRNAVVSLAKNATEGSQEDWFGILRHLFGRPMLANHRLLHEVTEAESDMIADVAADLIVEMEASADWREEYRSRPRGE